MAEDTGEKAWLNRAKKQCKNCNMVFYDWTIQDHLSHSEECKNAYSQQEIKAFQERSKSRKNFFDANTGRRIRSIKSGFPKK